MELSLENAERFARERTITYRWKLGTLDYEGWEQGIELVIGHNKYRKSIEATLYLVGYRDGFRKHSVQVFDRERPSSKVIEAVPCARYSDKALSSVESAALARFGVVNDTAALLLAVA